MKTIAACLLACASAWPAVAQQQVDFRWLGKMPGQSTSSATEVSEDGRVVAGTSVNKGFRWTVDGGLEDIGHLPGMQQTLVKGMSKDGGTIVGTCLQGSGTMPYVWTSGGGITQLPLPAGGVRGAALCVSGDGRVAGGWWCASLTTSAATPVLPLVWVDGVPTEVPRVSASITQSMVDALNRDGSIRVGRNVWVVPSGSPAQGADQTTGLCDDGSAAFGVIGGGAGIFKPLVGGLEPLGSVPALLSNAISGTGSNRAGLIVGWASIGGMPVVPRAVVWNHRSAMLLSDWLGQYGVSLGSDLLTQGLDITPDGSVIVGQGYHDGAYEGFWVRLPPACGADLAGQGATVFPDGRLDQNDLIVFVDGFFNRRTFADVGGVGGVPGRDAQWTNDDFVVYIDSFFAGCP